jgi:iron-sulfur cluster repair protein YtfE (RIC family)
MLKCNPGKGDAEMLIKIGDLKEPSGIVDLLLECHERIRSFVDLACHLGEATAPSKDEIRDAAARVSRYFSEALPFHVADEEQSIVPRLTGKSPELDTALRQMHMEHQEHEENVRTLIETCDTLKTSPDMFDQLRKPLLAAASSLQTEFAAHLKQEEDLIFPAIRSLLTPDEQAMMVKELRQRRR